MTDKKPGPRTMEDFKLQDEMVTEMEALLALVDDADGDEGVAHWRA
jgi:hypothetical protein